MMADRGFWKGKKVLVTGHTGFKGSWLSIWLMELGAEVYGYSLDPYSELDNFVVSGLKDRMGDLRGDVRDFPFLLSVFTKYRPEIVFHLAAQPLVRLSYESPKDTYDINIGGTVNVLEAIRRTDSVKVGVLITTDKCYENKEWIWGYRENDPLGGFDPYSSSKGAAELVIAGYRSSFFHPEKFEVHGKAVASARAGNVIGGGDWAKDRIVPDCIRALQAGKPIEVRNPEATRPWQHVLEPLSGYLVLAEKMYENGPKYAGPWNFGPDNDAIVPVKTIAGHLIHLWGQGKWVDLSGPDSFHEAKLLALDCSKAKTILNWEPVLELDMALKFTVDWYKNYQNSNSYDLCREQINAYTRLANHKKQLKTDFHKLYQEAAPARVDY
ncbi:MAG: CDP-glucose 4,6-dehydratase [Firmicutes bacterium]|nr:CDP-glucose 4,6-dehydratase [Bacillota bacterium]